MALEFRDKGYAMMLGPTTGPLGRSVYGSRLFEGWGSDPWLNGKMFGVGVKAIQQQDVIASGKHYLGKTSAPNAVNHIMLTNSS